ncbi:MAG: hypothetical protein K2Q22_01115 [Cytophagales bacterium]|nr:hypothetical protein [Cytophagales bacterium]
MINKILHYLKADNSKSLFASFLVAFFGFLIFAFLTRQFTLDELGNWVVFTTCCTMFELLRTGLLQTAMVKNITGASDDEQKKIIGSAWIIGILIT